MIEDIKIRRTEWLIYGMLWLTVFLMAVFISQDDYGVNWTRVYREWYRFLPFFFVFLIHNLILFPYLFNRKSKLLYFVLTIMLVLIVGILAPYFTRLFGDQLGFAKIRPPMQGPPGFSPPPMKKPIMMLFLDNTIISFLVVGFNAAIKVSIMWQAQEQKTKELEKEKLKSELAFLRNQVSPHFFMNTLNNIHALIDINSEDAKDSVIKLSKLMRYLLYESDQAKVLLSKEVEFIRSYVELMRLRYSDKVDIDLSISEMLPEKEISPMLFTSLLENAFKHGISYKQDSFISIMMNADDDQLYFRIKNSIHDAVDADMEDGGLGLQNLQKRLDLIYGENHSFHTSENNQTFEVNIRLPLHDN